MRIVSIGEILWDIIGGREHLGGAPFNFAVHASRLGHEVRFISAVGEDELGRRALAAAAALALPTAGIQRIPGQPTGTVTVELDASGQPSFTIRRPAAYDFVRFQRGDPAGVDWIYFGTLLQMDTGARAAVAELVASAPAARRFYDVNLRPHSYTPGLVRDLLAQANVVKLNEEEAVEVGRIVGERASDPEAWCRAHAARFGWHAACITRGALGCAILINNDYAEVPGRPVAVKDTVGAGDAFAAAFLHGFANGWPAAKAGAFANRLGALVAAREGGVPPWTRAEIEPF